MAKITFHVLLFSPLIPFPHACTCLLHSGLPRCPVQFAVYRTWPMVCRCTLQPSVYSAVFRTLQLSLVGAGSPSTALCYTLNTDTSTLYTTLPCWTPTDKYLNDRSLPQWGRRRGRAATSPTLCCTIPYNTALCNTPTLLHCTVFHTNTLYTTPQYCNEHYPRTLQCPLPHNTLP